MGKFEFRKHGILLDIEGVQVTVPATVEYAKKLEDAGEKMRTFGAQLKEEKDVERGLISCLTFWMTFWARIRWMPLRRRGMWIFMIVWIW